MRNLRVSSELRRHHAARAVTVDGGARAGVPPRGTLWPAAAWAGATLIALLATLLAVRPVGAQAPASAAAASAQPRLVDGRWRGWLGCWQSVDPAERTLTVRGVESATVCVVPAAEGRGVELRVLSGAEVVSRERIDATGAEVTVEREGCTGRERTAWSSDGRRVYRTSALTCDGVERRGSALFAITAEGEWLRVDGVAVNGESAVRAVRLREVNTPGEAAEPSPVVQSSVLSPRLLAGARVSVEAVLEAARQLDGPVVEAWLTELRQPFPLDARQLVRLHAAGLSPRLLDVLVAVSHPERFAVRPATPSMAPAGAGFPMAADRGWGRPIGADPWLWDRWGYGYGFGAYGLGWSPYGVGPYGGWGGVPWGSNWYFGSTPVVIAPTSPSTPASVAGRAVNGAGYTRREGGGTASPRPAIYDAPASRGSGGMSGGSMGGGASGGGSTGGGSTGRTAKPRGG